MVGEMILTQDMLNALQQDSIGKTLLNSDKFVEEMYHKLKGEIWTDIIQTDEQGNRFLIKGWKQLEGTTPVMNEKGLSETINALNMGMSMATASGKVQDIFIRRASMQTYVYLIQDYYSNYKENGLTDFSQCDLIAHQILVNFYCHLSKSENMALVKEMFTSYHVSEIRNLDKNNKAIEMPKLTL